MNRLRRDLLVYYGYKAATSLTLYQPITFLYFRSIGLSWMQIAALEAVGSLTTVLTEVPTGYVGDRIGRLDALVVGTALVALSLFSIAVAESFVLLAVVYPLWSLGWNLRSGNDPAWLYDRLAAVGRADRFAEFRGRAKAVGHAVGIPCAVLGGYLGTRDLALPFFVAACLSAIGLPALFALQNVADDCERDDQSPRDSVGLVRGALTHRRLSPFVVYYFVLFASALAVVFVYAQPVVETYATDAAYDGSVEQLLGFLYAAISLVSAVLSSRTGLVADVIGLRRWFGAVPVAVGVGLACPIVAPVLTLPAILLSRGVGDVTQTLADQYVNDHLGSTARATILSATRMVRKLASIPVLLVSGWAADAGLTTVEVLAIAGLVLVAGVVVLGRRTFARFGPHSTPDVRRDCDHAHDHARDER